MLEWHYGPTAADSDAGKMWHTGCGGEILAFDEGLICLKCGEQDDGSATHAIESKESA